MEAARVATGPAKPHGIDELFLPINPSNIKVGGRFQVEGVTNDLYNIANRLTELNPNLFINILEDRSPEAVHKVVYVIMERTLDNKEQVVFRCYQLDERVLEHVRYLMRIPFKQRFEEAEKELKKYEAEEHENELDDLVERLGLPMQRELRECGFLGEYGKPDVARSRRAFGRG